jgi:hypothetical protein
MPKLTLTEAQKRLLEIIGAVESGIDTPEEAVIELNDLKRAASEAGLPFKAAYELADFQKIRADQLSTYESSEPSYQSSSSY